MKEMVPVEQETTGTQEETKPDGEVIVNEPVVPIEVGSAPIKSIGESIGESNTLGTPGRNKSDKDHAYNVWLFQAHGDLLPDSWRNKEKFKSYVKHHPPKLIFSPEEGFRPNPKKRKGRTNGTAGKNRSSKIISIERKREAR